MGTKWHQAKKMLHNVKLLCSAVYHDTTPIYQVHWRALQLKAIKGNGAQH